jgi:hypothetical protein
MTRLTIIDDSNDIVGMADSPRINVQTKGIHTGKVTFGSKSAFPSNLHGMSSKTVSGWEIVVGSGDDLMAGTIRKADGLTITFRIDPRFS